MPTTKYDAPSGVAIVAHGSISVFAGDKLTSLLAEHAPDGRRPDQLCVYRPLEGSETAAILLSRLPPRCQAFGVAKKPPGELVSLCRLIMAGARLPGEMVIEESWTMSTALMALVRTAPDSLFTLLCTFPEHASPARLNVVGEFHESANVFHVGDESSLRYCGGCSATPPRLLRCSCRLADVRYCSRACQRVHWPRHRLAHLYGNPVICTLELHLGRVRDVPAAELEADVPSIQGVIGPDGATMFVVPNFDADGALAYRADATTHLLRDIPVYGGEWVVFPPNVFTAAAFPAAVTRVLDDGTIQARVGLTPERALECLQMFTGRRPRDMSVKKHYLSIRCTKETGR